MSAKYETAPGTSLVDKWIRALPAALSCAALLMTGLAGASETATLSKTWVTTWSATPTFEGDGFASPGTGFSNQTIRQVVRVSAGGLRIRVRFTNEFGTSPLAIGGAQIALAAPAGAIVPGTNRVLTFNGGSPTATVPAGAPLLSDPLDFATDNLSSLAVDLYLSGSSRVGSATWHAEAHQTAYISLAGNKLGNTSFPASATTTSRYFLSGVEVLAAESSGPNGLKAVTVVAFGDSITDGTSIPDDSNQRWPDFLAERLQAARQSSTGVANEGFGGNHLLLSTSMPFFANPAAPPALARFDRDVLSKPHVKHVIVFIGNNDIGQGITMQSSPNLTADDLISGYKQLIARAHAQGAKIYGATLTPFKQSSYYSEAAEKIRQAVNAWIRTGGLFDSVIDFDAAIRDPLDSGKMLASYSSDYLHPNAAGYKRMADVIDLRLFLNSGN